VPTVVVHQVAQSRRPEPEPQPPVPPVEQGGALAPSVVETPAADEQPTLAVPITLTKAEPEAEAEAQPERPLSAADTITFAPRGVSMVWTVVLSIGALLAAGNAGYAAVMGNLFSPIGIVATVATVVLVLALLRTRSPGATVWIDRGVVHVVLATGGHHQFDLENPLTEVTMVDQPGRKAWRVQFARRTMTPFEVDPTMVDPQAFTAALRRWRPSL
jgi:hypothetical protein